MEILDWGVLIIIMVLIVFYGVKQNQIPSDSESYLKGNRSLPWWTIGLSVMATQASAITFLSVPGQAYDEGLRFIQFYFGLPVAIIVLCVFVLPKYYQLNVYTAYEYLEKRFDVKVRSLAAILFLCQRGLATGLTLFAPSIVLSSILGWNLSFTTLYIGLIVIGYMILGGTLAVSKTQKQQMLIIFLGLIVAVICILQQMPSDISLKETLHLAEITGKLQVIDTSFDLSNKYTIWSSLLGGTFLFLSYFGTDQSQVQRYLSGKSLKECQLGLVFNALCKIPVQFFILAIGVLVFVFLQFHRAPLHFNQYNINQLKNSSYHESYQVLENQWNTIHQQKQEYLSQYLREAKEGTTNLALVENIKQLFSKEEAIRIETKSMLSSFADRTHTRIETEDTDYIFINFIVRHLPNGVIGLLISVIILAAMSATASAINALTTTTVIDFYKRLCVPNQTDKHYLKTSKVVTLIWGVISIFFAMTITLFDNLIEAVNIIGSLFYGVVLGIFVIGFFISRIKADAVFIAAVIAEIIVIVLFVSNQYQIIQIAYLWLNLIGCSLVIGIAFLVQLIQPQIESKNKRFVMININE